MNGDSMEKIKINLNEYIWFKPTEKGKEAFRNRFQRLEKKMRELGMTGPSFPMSEIKVDENGYAKMQLWEVMNVFGEHLGIGFDSVINPLEIIVERYEKVEEKGEKMDQYTHQVQDTSIAGQSTAKSYITYCSHRLPCGYCPLMSRPCPMQYGGNTVTNIKTETQAGIKLPTSISGDGTCGEITTRFSAAEA